MSSEFDKKYYDYYSIYIPPNKITKKQNLFNINLPYIDKRPDPFLDLKMLYNLTTTNIPFGSTYKYTIPGEIDQLIDKKTTSFSSISAKQKRGERETFKNIKVNKKNKNKIYIYLIIIFALIFILTNIR